MSSQPALRHPLIIKEVLVEEDLRMDQLEVQTAVCPPPRPTRKDAKWRLFLFMSCIGLFWYMNRGQESEWLPFGDSSLKSDDFSWSQINPSESLVYTSCFGTYQCACLSVPMDWNSTSSNGSQVALAVIKMPAPVSVMGHRYGGAILVNPGGPGGSGVENMLFDGSNMSAIVNPLSSIETFSDGKYFDLISWDPRGVNNTTPHLECFHDSSSYDVWRNQKEADGIDHTSNISLSLEWARWKALMETCAQEGNEISKHMNTVPVVRDMVEIIERHGEWRSKQADVWLASKEGKSTTCGTKKGDLYSRDSIIDRTKWYKGDEKLQYWGFSYGTALGQTFATMYPTRVGRMILDGVANANDYYNAAWMMGLNDTDKVMSKFYEYCSSAGPEKCALNVDNSTSSDIQQSVESLVSSLHEDPISVAGNSTRSPEVITYSDVVVMVRALMYRPLDEFPKMAELLADVVHGNGSAFAAYKQNSHKRTCPFDETPGKKKYPKSCQSPGRDEVTRAILCSDGIDLYNTTKEDFKGTVEALYQQSRWMGEYWGTITLPCRHWKVRPKWGITGDEIGGNTSHPILWIGNTLDPVTPLANAHTMSKSFPGSVVLQQDSEGHHHCSVSSPSVCTHGIIRKYFQTGDLPTAGTVCQPDKRPLIGHVTSLEDDLSGGNSVPSVDLREEKVSRDS